MPHSETRTTKLFAHIIGTRGQGSLRTSCRTCPVDTGQSQKDRSRDTRGRPRPCSNSGQVRPLTYTASPLQKIGDDLANDFIGGLVFPKTKNCPSRLKQQAIDPTVTPPIRVQLFPPPVRIAFRIGPMVGAKVPEAAVKKDHHSPPTPRQVTSEGVARENFLVDPEPKPFGMKAPPDIDLDLCSRRLLQAHLTPNRFR